MQLIYNLKSFNIKILYKFLVNEKLIFILFIDFCLYFSLIVVSVLLISIEGKSTEVNVTSVLTCINNVGPGFGEVGPAGNFGAFSIFSKLLLSVNMLIGRLEILPMLVFFSPAVWKKH